MKWILPAKEFNSTWLISIYSVSTVVQLRVIEFTLVEEIRSAF